MTMTSLMLDKDEWAMTWSPSKGFQLLMPLTT
jgi:hypothetical protein